MDIYSYITGFVDGEGWFSVSFSRRQKMNFGIEVGPSFSVSQHKRNYEVLIFLSKHFDCGGIRFSRNDQNYKFEVRNLTKIISNIIPHFEKFQLLTSKKNDFLLFREICFLMKRNLHVSKDGLIKIIDLAYKMNESGKRKYTKDELLKYVVR